MAGPAGADQTALPGYGRRTVLQAVYGSRGAGGQPGGFRRRPQAGDRLPLDPYRRQRLFRRGVGRDVDVLDRRHLLLSGPRHPDHRFPERKLGRSGRHADVQERRRQGICRNPVPQGVGQPRGILRVHRQIHPELGLRPHRVHGQNHHAGGHHRTRPVPDHPRESDPRRIHRNLEILLHPRQQRLRERDSGPGGRLAD